MRGFYEFVVFIKSFGLVNPDEVSSIIIDHADPLILGGPGIACCKKSARRGSDCRCSRLGFRGSDLLARGFWFRLVLLFFL